MDDNNGKYLLINEGSLMGGNIFRTLLEKDGGRVETVDSFTAAAKKLRFNSYTCTLIFADGDMSLTQIRSSLSDDLVCILHDGSYSSSESWVIRDDTIHILRYEEHDIERTVSQIHDLIAEATIDSHVSKHTELQAAVRHILSSFQTADSRKKVETTVCEQLISSDLYTTGWISIVDKTTDTLRPVVAVGIDSRHLASTSPKNRCRDEIHVEGEIETGYTITVPLHHNSELVGTLSLTTFRTVDDAEQELLRELGNDLVTAIQQVTKRPHQVSVKQTLETYTQSFSHELRNHLQTAKAELQAESEDEEQFDHVLDVLERIERLNQDALLLTQQSIDEERLSSHSLTTIVEDVQTRMPQMTDRVEIQASTSIIAHRPLVELLLENLFRNSLDHAGATAEIHIGVLEDGFFVEDTGDGLPDVPIHSLFEWQMSVDGNSGIGLAIVKQITDLHGWDITATESADGGARFEITGIPVDRELIASE